MSEDRCHLRAVAERQRPGETFEQEAAKRVLVGAAVDDVTTDLLGRDIVDRPHELPICRTRGRRGVGKTEVRKIGVIPVALLIQQHVARLDIAVHEPRWWAASSASASWAAMSITRSGANGAASRSNALRSTPST